MVKNNIFLRNIFVFYKNYLYICKDFKRLVFDIFKIENRELTQTALSTVLKTAGTFGYGGRHLNSLRLGKHTANLKKWIIIKISVF